MSQTYKILSLLLSYPGGAIQSAATELKLALRKDGLLPSDIRGRLEATIDEMAGADLYELQERYVLLFDRTRSLSLNLFEHVHGESRDRGQAMVDLLATYEAHGLYLTARELPDHLPLFLEFLSTLPEADATTYLGEAAHVIAALKVRLEKRESAYAAVFDALAALAGPLHAAAEVAERALREDDDPNDLAALDAAWEEAAVTFGPDPNAGCPVARDMLAEMTASTRGQ